MARGPRRKKAGIGDNNPPVEEATDFAGDATVEEYRAVALTPPSALEQMYRTAADYRKLVDDVVLKFEDVNRSQWDIVLFKAEIGGRSLRAKQIVGHGRKGEIAGDFDLHENTLARYEKLYNFLPLPGIIDEYEKTYVKVDADGETERDHVYSIINLCKTIDKVRAERGMLRQKYIGTGKVVLIDPATKFAAAEQPLPDNFANRANQKPHWEMWEKQRFGKNRQQTVWVEKQNADYYEDPDFKIPKYYFEIGEPDSRVGYNDRVVIAQITTSKAQREVLDMSRDPFDMSLIDLVARKPEKVGVIMVSPSKQPGLAQRIYEMNSNEFVGLETRITKLELPYFMGLSVCEYETGSVFKFKIGDQEFSGLSYIFREDPEDPRWIIPLDFQPSEAEVQKRIEFVTLNKLAEDEKPTEPDPYLGYEVVDEGDKVRDYFALEPATYENFVRHIKIANGDEDKGLSYDELEKTGLLKRDGEEYRWHIEKVKPMVTAAKAKLAAKAQAEADEQARIAAEEQAEEERRKAAEAGKTHETTPEPDKPVPPATSPSEPSTAQAGSATPSQPATPSEPSGTPPKIESEAEPEPAEKPDDEVVETPTPQQVFDDGKELVADLILKREQAIASGALPVVHQNLNMHVDELNKHIAEWATDAGKEAAASKIAFAAQQARAYVRGIPSVDVRQARQPETIEGKAEDVTPKESKPKRPELDPKNVPEPPPLAKDYKTADYEERESIDEQQADATRGYLEKIQRTVDAVRSSPDARDPDVLQMALANNAECAKQAVFMMERLLEHIELLKLESERRPAANEDDAINRIRGIINTLPEDKRDDFTLNITTRLIG